MQVVLKTEYSLEPLHSLKLEYLEIYGSVGIDYETYDATCFNKSTEQDKFSELDTKRRY